MPTSQTIAIPHPDVVCTELQNGDTVLLHLGSQTYFTVNETGSRIWQLLADGLTVAEIGQELETRYEVTPERAQQSVINLVTDLAQAQLVTLSSADQAGEPEAMGNA